ncbi:interferon regulatory factor 7 [Pithys albifrons albifrons]|uniref:interferon regulatory factor 7 n=1 Tax=Pithys albifrons albifrons TaxID=3385563 RepID=UPI003A5D13CF
MAALENEGETQRLRFGPWLLDAINSGRYLGLRWLDPNRTTFRVPWKHNARKDITDSDLEVFKAWARVSGRYEESSEDPAKWKTNFRCALRSTRMFRLLKDHSKCGEDPHKVFTINQATLQQGEEGDFGSPDSAGDQQPAQQQLQPELHSQDVAPEIALPGITDPTQPGTLEKLLQQCDISPCDLVSWVPEGDALQLDIPLQTHQDTLLQLLADSGQNNCFPPTAFAQWVPTVKQPTLGTYDTYSRPDLMPLEELGAMPLPCHLTEGAVPMQSPGEAMFLVPNPVPQPQQLEDNTGGFFSPLDITIYYRGKEFHRQTVEGSHCLLTYQRPNTAVAQGPWHVVCFPSPADMADRKQWRITENLLGIVGLQLEQRAHKVFATRREKCKVFWALSQQLEGAEDPPSNILCRDQEAPIFDFTEFHTELRDFHNGQRRRSPDFTIYLCFGQAFSRDKPKESKLILVKLVPKFCEYWYEKVLQEGASSLDSQTISLQLSDSFSLYELIEQYNMQLE